MLRKVLLWTGLALTAGSGTQAQALPDSLTAEQVVALARARAPQVRVAESEVVAARGRLSGARALGQENPTIEGVANTDDRFERRTQWELSVPIGVGLQRRSRVGVAKAELEGQQRLVADARRGAVGGALAAYFRVLHAMGRVELATERRALAADLVRTATERHRAGDAPRLEVLLTETENIRAESELFAEEEGLTRSRIGLALALALPSVQGIPVAGDLADRSIVAAPIERGAPGVRSDVLAAESDLQAAKAARGLARTDWLPHLAFRLNYGHEGGDPLVQPGLAVSVPLFQYGQDSRQIARAREIRAQAELERVRNSSAAEIEGLGRAYEASTAAAARLEERGLPRVQESEGMAIESYRAGKIDLPALLIVRRELLETRREYLDRLLEAALAGIDLAVAQGHFQ